MPRVNARGIITSMEHTKIVWNFIEIIRPHKSMRKPSFLIPEPTNHKHAISLSIPTSLPLPTFTHISNRNFIKESTIIRTIFSIRINSIKFMIAIRANMQKCLTHGLILSINNIYSRYTSDSGWDGRSKPAFWSGVLQFILWHPFLKLDTLLLYVL